MGRIDSRLIVSGCLAATIAAGLFVKGLSAILAPYALPALFIMIIASLVPMARLKLEEIFSLELDVLRIVFWQLFVLPSIMIAATYLLKVSPNIVNLMAVTACAGSLFASPALADLLGLNQRKALQCMVLSTFVMPGSYFVFFTIVMHAAVEIQIADFVGRTAVFLLLPAAIFLFYSAYAESMNVALVEKIESVARWVTIIALMIFGLGIIGPAAKLLADDPRRFAIFLVIVTALGASMAFLTTIVMYRQGITNALTASIVAGFRNVGLGFVLIQGSASDETAAYVGISQIPIFIAPLLMRLFITESAHAEASGNDGAEARPRLSGAHALPQPA
jgi:hypothetical protein